MLLTSQFIAIIGLLLGTAVAVDLRQYSSSNCNGNTRTECRNIKENSCCSHGGGAGYKSGSCKGSEQNLRHTIYRGNSGNACRNRVSAGECSKCISDSRGTMTGHKWSSSKRVMKRSFPDFGFNEYEAGDDSEETGCMRSVEPDLIVIDGRAFELNGTSITEEQRSRLWAYFNEHSKLLGDVHGFPGRSAFSIPAEFDEFEVTLEDLMV